MKRFVFPLLCALALGSGYAVQQDLQKPILKVNGQTLTSQDLELVKAMLPLEQFKTSKGRTKLIDGIYTQFLIQKTLLEQNGMSKINAKQIQEYISNPNFPKIVPKGYSPEGFAAKTLLGFQVALHSSVSRSDLLQILLQRNDVRSGAIREYKINQWFINEPSPIKLHARAMLLASSEQARQLQQKILRGGDFTTLAKRYSLTRRNIGGMLGGDSNAVVSLRYIEPELQVGIATSPKRGLHLVAAPFGRAWLVDIQSIEIPKDSPNILDDQSVFLSGARFLYTADGQAALFSDQVSRNFDLQNSQIGILDQELGQTNPMVGQVGKATAKLADALATHFFIEDALNFPDVEKRLSRDLDVWLTHEVTRQQLPNNGAGTELGLETYLAARANVSEAQLKAFYLSNKTNYLIGNTFVMTTCTFQNRALAIDMRQFLFVMPATSGLPDAEPYGNHCDALEVSSSQKVPIPINKNTFQPVADGFIGQLQKTKDGYFFILLNRYLPQPMLKPFILVRGEVEREYRRLVAKKQLPTFERNLREKAGAKNLLEQALKDLEQ